MICVRLRFVGTTKGARGIDGGVELATPPAFVFGVAEVEAADAEAEVEAVIVEFEACPKLVVGGAGKVRVVPPPNADRAPSALCSNRPPA